MFRFPLSLSRKKFTLVAGLVWISLSITAFPLYAQPYGRQGKTVPSRITLMQKKVAALRKQIQNLAAFAPAAEPQQAPDIYYVNGDVATSGRGTNWTDAFKTIQEAVDAASNGACIWIKKGVYPLTTQIVIDKALIVQGGFSGLETTPEERIKDGVETVIDGQDLTRCLLVSKNVYLEELTITGGEVSATDNEFGGGILISRCSPVLRYCRFRANDADWDWDTYAAGLGGAMYIDNGSPYLSDCIFEDNAAGPTTNEGTSGRGGAVYIAGGMPGFLSCEFTGNYADEYGGAVYGQAYLIGCDFSGNFSARDGGAVYSSPESVISESVFRGNSAEYSGGGLAGGGTLLHCRFYNNYADDAGGGARIGTNTTLYSCTFAANIVTNDFGQFMGGGALYIDGGTSNFILNSVFYKNDVGINDPLNGGAIYNCGNTMIFNSTFYGNNTYTTYYGGLYGKGGAIYFNGSSLILLNCILWENIGAPAAIAAEGSPAHVYFSDVDQDGFAGSNFNIRLDPQFADAVNGDLHLTAGSPCIDAGINALLYAVPEDFEGDNRIINGTGGVTARIDMGADEYKP